ncbi:hypothetical protein HMPREF0083_04102 [Aneurinibacillus aneurinilyticus ATCC 12856]|uniref:Uncharacterized protein n=1 Tax=Aneurinibacillus aneurinilyticus ATCC 12856 TaxID=649747 RepID=U1WYT0_ANEAE|nr:hypothetical protein HMPREF0083_04102 [Aneurinibacillus aneurinilyticus ATCC 12856]
MVCRSANLADIDTPFAKDDAVKKGEQMATLASIEVNSTRKQT